MNVRWGRLTVVGVIVGVVQGAVFSHVGTFFYSNDALRLSWFVLPPYVINLVAAAVARTSRPASILIAAGTWSAVAYALWSYVSVFFFMPPDGQKVLVFLAVCVIETGGALFVLLTATAIRFVGNRDRGREPVVSGR